MYNIFLIIIIDSELYMKLCTLVKEVNYGKESNRIWTVSEYGNSRYLINNKSYKKNV